MNTMVLGTKCTGSYEVRLLDAGGCFSLAVTYLGAYAGGTIANVDLEVPSDAEAEDVLAWFENAGLDADVKGDHDVEQALAIAGYDTYGNRTNGRLEPWTIDC